MNDLANSAPSRALNDFVNGLLQNPVSNERFTATFTLADAGSGSVQFRHLHSPRSATLEWNTRFEQEQLQALLLYNHRIVLLHCPAGEFRQKVADTYLIF